MTSTGFSTTTLVAETFLKFCRDSDVVQAEWFTLNCQHIIQDINCADNNGNTALQIVAAYNHVDLAESLILAGAQIEASNEYGFTPLHHAAFNGNTETVRTLLKHNADTEATNIFGATALLLACKRGHTDVVKTLLDHGAEIDTTTIGFLECSPLIVAAIGGHEGVVKTLVASGANVNQVVDATGYTPLMYAALKCQLATIQLLLDNGVDPSVSSAHNSRHPTALHLARACEPSKGDVVALLEACVHTSACATTASTNQSTAHVYQPPNIFQAIFDKDLQMIKRILLADPAQIDLTRAPDGCTPLMAACVVGDLAVVELLTSAKAELNLQLNRVDKIKGWTALMLSCFYRHVALANFLVSMGVDCCIR